MAFSKFYYIGNYSYIITNYGYGLFPNFVSLEILKLCTIFFSLCWLAFLFCFFTWLAGLSGIQSECMEQSKFYN